MSNPPDVNPPCRPFIANLLATRSTSGSGSPKKEPIEEVAEKTGAVVNVVDVSSADSAPAAEEDQNEDTTGEYLRRISASPFWHFWPNNLICRHVHSHSPLPTFPPPLPPLHERIRLLPVSSSSLLVIRHDVHLSNTSDSFPVNPC